MEINLKQIVASKSPFLARIIPRPIYSWLHRTLRLDGINYLLTNFSHMPPAEFIRSSLGYMQVTYRMEGLENLDPKGRYLLASNHPFGGLDGIILAESVENRMGEVRVIVNDLLMNLPPLAPIFIPVNKHGRQKGGSAQLLREAFATDVPIVTFPAGLCSRRKKGVVCDLEWRSNFVKMALEYRRDIVPVYVDGRLSNFFYRLSNLRTALKIKANIEMLYLVDEMFRQNGRNIRIVVGTPLPWQQVAEWGLRPAEAAGRIKNMAYALKK